VLPAICDRKRDQFFSVLNIFQFAKYPANVQRQRRRWREKYRNRRNITYQQALHYYRLMEGEAREICLKCFAYEVKGQAVYNGVENDSESSHRWIKSQFSNGKCVHAWLRRNLNDEDVDLSRRVIVVGKMIEKRLFPHETPIGKIIRMDRSQLHDRRRAR
jgi:hypothetical protein